MIVFLFTTVSMPGPTLSIDDSKCPYMLYNDILSHIQDPLAVATL